MGCKLTWLVAKSRKTSRWLYPLSGGRSGAMSMPRTVLGVVVWVVMFNLCGFVVVYMCSWHGRHFLIRLVIVCSILGKWYFPLMVRKTRLAARWESRGPLCSMSMTIGINLAGRTIVGWRFCMSSVCARFSSGNLSSIPDLTMNDRGLLDFAISSLTLVQ